MKKLDSLLTKFDKYQIKHPVFGFPLAVMKKYGNDSAGSQAASMSYYAFMSLFPILLIVFSLVGVVASNNVGLQDRIIDAVLHYFPILGQQLRSNIQGFHHRGYSMAIALLVLLYGSLGFGNSLQNTSNNLWGIKKSDRPNFINRTTRSVCLIVFGGLGIVLTTIILSFANNIDKSLVLRMLVVVLALLLNMGVFMIVFRIATVKQIKTRQLVAGAFAAAIFWQILQAIGGLLILHQLKRSSELYGIFALVLGLMFWIYIQINFTLYAIELNTVKSKKLWPKNFFLNPRG